MTDVSGAVREDATGNQRPADDATVPEPGPRTSTIRDHGRPRRVTVALACLAALVALGCAAALPFAPVSVNEPTVSWPRDPARPQSTLLTLTGYRPLTLTVGFSCDTARRAETEGGLLLSTALPQSPLPTGLAVTVTDGRVAVRSLGAVVLDEPLPAGPCAYTITGSSAGRPVPLEAAGTDPAAGRPAGTAGPTDALLTVTRDGTELAGAAGDRLPDVDVLATALTGTPDGGLSVRMRVDDEFTSSPTPAKRVLIWTLCGALAVTLLALWRLDSGAARVGRRWRFALPRVVDLVVPAVMIGWLFVAPATDDDGYYAAMARNAGLTGRVGNYYQLYDQNFTPFTWFYQLLAWWQQLVGDAAVLQRIPALACGLATWVVIRRFAAAALTEWERPGRPVRAICHGVLAVTFLSWWVPQAMGVRPESVVALCSAAAMLAVLTAARRRRLVLAWLAVALAGVGFTAHPTGFTLLAPLLAGLPLLWSVLRVPGRRLATAGRALAVAAAGLTAPLLAFADGSLRDFRRGQAIFLSVQGQEDWTSEVLRYQFLLTPNPMGNFAKRAAVLVALVALVWFVALVAAARARRVRVPVALWLSGATLAASFAALWLTPSKWTHHFGSLSGTGAVFLALFAVMSVPLLLEVLDGRRLPFGVLAVAGGSFAVAIALAWHGPNSWPYAWLAGVRRPDLPPAVKRVPLDSPLVWLAVLAAVAAALVLIAHARGRDRRAAALLAVPVVVVVSLAANLVYTVGTFADAAVRGAPASSIWAQSLADPTARRCGAASALRVLDPATATPLPDAGLPAPPPPAGFVPGGGYYRGNHPQGGATDQGWGSLDARDGRTAEQTTATMSTGWYALPAALPAEAAVTVLAAGTLEDGNQLTATYARRQGAAAVPVGSRQLSDPARSPVWRTLVLHPPAGADLVRLDAVDASGFVHGWLAFTAPAVTRPAGLLELIPAGAPVAVGWQHAFNYPCLRQPRVVDGITEPPRFGVLWGDDTLAALVDDGTWQPARGGLFGQVTRTRSVQRLATVPSADPNAQVYVFSSDLPGDPGAGGYTVSRTRRTVPGGSVGTGTGPAAAPAR